MEGIRDRIIMWHPPAGMPCILDGHNRYDIACKHGIGYELESLNLRTLEEAQRWVIDNQLARRNLSAYAKGELGLQLLEIEKRAARERMAEGGRAKGSANLPEASKGEARAKAAGAVGVSPRQLDKVLFLNEHADEETKARLRAGETSVHREHVRLKREQRKDEAREAIESKPQALPDGPFDVVVADPPWSYFLRAEDALHRGRVPYPAMSTDQICDLQVAKLAADDCILWLWTTNAHMHDAFHVCEAWGFKHVSILTWGKNKIGAGHWLRGRTEHCLLATKGKPVHDLKGQSTLLEAPRREHSRKPDEFFALVESLCPGSKVELFAREQRPGWHSWGAEKEKFDESVDLAVGQLWEDPKTGRRYRIVTTDPPPMLPNQIECDVYGKSTYRQCTRSWSSRDRFKKFRLLRDVEKGKFDGQESAG
jgi:N6-adenosine-specific RNA methylase IME4